MNARPLRYTDTGETHLPLLFFVHGWPDSAALWSAHVLHFRGRYRCVCVDLPGFGSDGAAPGEDFPELAERVRATLDVVTAGKRPPEIVLVGHDWGAYLAYHYERRYPETIDRFVTMDVGAHVVPRSFGHGVFLVSYQWWLVLAYFVGKLLPPLGNAMARVFARYAEAPEAAKTRSSMNYLYAYFWRARLLKRFRDRILRRYRPTKPLLYLYGAKSPYPFHSPRWETLVRETPGSAVVGIPSGHWFLVRESAATQAALDRWLTL